jgi:vacuolar-type H+-ATPase subunit F/Vma7
VTGVLLAGVGVRLPHTSFFPGQTSDLALQHVTDPPDAQKNYLVVDHKTETHTIEEAFDSFTQERKDIAIVLINQHVRPPLRLSHLISSLLGRMLISLADCRQDPQPRRRIHPSLPLAPRDSLKGPPLRPRKGQRHEARQEVVWRVNHAVSHVQRYPEYKSIIICLYCNARMLHALESLDLPLYIA